MAENISMTRIVDLPDMQSGPMYSSDQNGLGADMYIPINGHPNPYGIPPPPAGGIAPPQQTQNVNPQYKNTMYSSQPQYTQEQMNEMFNQTQRLPQRDIPMNITDHTQDEQIQPNYIPRPKITSDYIQEYQETTDKQIKQHEKQKLYEKKTETWLDEMQIPIMIALLYFIFQLPIINTIIFKRFSFLAIYREDGNFNMFGLFLKSILFSSLFFSINKTIEIISKI